MLGSVISSVWRLMRGSGGGASPFEPPLMQIARRIHQQRQQLAQQQTGQLTQQQPLQPLQQQAEQPLQQVEQPPAQLAQTMRPGQPMQPGQPMPSFGPYDQNQFLHSLLGGATRSMFRRPWSTGQQMPGQPSVAQASVAQVLMRLLGGW